jgi:uncharacterized damage-inducible protein DinB
MEHVVELYRYNSHVRKKYLDAIERLPWEEVIEDRGASFGSVRNIFLHVLDVHRFWLRSVLRPILSGSCHFTEESFHNAEPDANPAAFHNAQDMRDYEKSIDNMTMDVVLNLSQEDLARPFTIDSANGTVETILMHLIEEELQHRGELNCLFWQAGHDPPVTGFGNL